MYRTSRKGSKRQSRKGSKRQSRKGSKRIFRNSAKKNSKGGSIKTTKQHRFIRSNKIVKHDDAVSNRISVTAVKNAKPAKHIFTQSNKNRKSSRGSSKSSSRFINITQPDTMAVWMNELSTVAIENNLIVPFQEMNLVARIPTVLDQMTKLYRGSIFSKVNSYTNKKLGKFFNVCYTFDSLNLKSATIINNEPNIIKYLCETKNNKYYEIETLIVSALTKNSEGKSVQMWSWNYMNDPIYIKMRAEISKYPELSELAFDRTGLILNSDPSIAFLQQWASMLILSYLFDGMGIIKIYGTKPDLVFYELIRSIKEIK